MDHVERFAVKHVPYNVVNRTLVYRVHDQATDTYPHGRIVGVPVDEHYTTEEAAETVVERLNFITRGTTP